MELSSLRLHDDWNLNSLLKQGEGALLVAPLIASLVVATSKVCGLSAEIQPAISSVSPHTGDGVWDAWWREIALEHRNIVAIKIEKHNGVFLRKPPEKLPHYGEEDKGEMKNNVAKWNIF